MAAAAASTAANLTVSKATNVFRFQGKRVATSALSLPLNHFV